MSPAVTAAEFERYCIPEPNSGCWLWEGRSVLCSPNYRQARSNVRGFEIAARLSWAVHMGAIPNALCVLHHCDNPMCVNPGHLFLGTHRDNTQDMMAKGRHRYISPRHGGPRKLSEQDVREIRASVSTHAALGQKYGVHRRTVGYVRSGQTWGNVA